MAELPRGKRVPRYHPSYPVVSDISALAWTDLVRSTGRKELTDVCRVPCKKALTNRENPAIGDQARRCLSSSRNTESHDLRVRYVLCVCPLRLDSIEVTGLHRCVPGRDKRSGSLARVLVRAASGVRPSRLSGPVRTFRVLLLFSHLLGSLWTNPAELS